MSVCVEYDMERIHTTGEGKLLSLSVPRCLSFPLRLGSFSIVKGKSSYLPIIIKGKPHVKRWGQAGAALQQHSLSEHKHASEQQHVSQAARRHPVCPACKTKVQHACHFGSQWQSTNFVIFIFAHFHSFPATLSLLVCHSETLNQTICSCIQICYLFLTCSSAPLGYVVYWLLSICQACSWPPPQGNFLSSTVCCASCVFVGISVLLLLLEFSRHHKSDRWSTEQLRFYVADEKNSQSFVLQLDFNEQLWQHKDDTKVVLTVRQYSMVWYHELYTTQVNNNH